MEVIVCRGHPNVLATHKTTIEITKETRLTKKGDCIVGVGAEKGINDLPDEFKEKLRSKCKIEIIFECGGIADTVHAHGSPDLILDHPTDMVIRQSGYVDRRTLAVGADKAAAGLDRGLVEKLKVGGKLTVRISVAVSSQLSQ